MVAAGVVLGAGSVLRCETCGGRVRSGEASRFCASRSCCSRLRRSHSSQNGAPLREAAASTPDCAPEPMSTVASPCTTTPPWFVGSPMRAASWLEISTFDEPFLIESGGALHCARSVTRAAGLFAMSTVASPVRIGPPTCGTGPGSTFGQTWLSPMREAGGMAQLLGPGMAPHAHAQRQRGVRPGVASRVALTSPRALA